MSVERVPNPEQTSTAEGAQAAEGSSNSCHNSSAMQSQLAAEVLSQLSAALPQILNRGEVRPG